MGAQLNPALPGGEDRLAGTEGITLRVKAEGHTYGCVLRTGKAPVVLHQLQQQRATPSLLQYTQY